MTRIQSQPVRGAELTARARLEQMFDAGTFFEIDESVHHRSRHFGMETKKAPGDGVICGFGEIEGRTVYAYSQDRSILGGSLGEAHSQKIVKIMDLAGKAGVPVVGINDSGGARIQEGVEALAGYGEIFRRNVKFSGVIPQISLLMGPCAGGAVYSPALTDFVVMVDKKSFMFVTGPKVVQAVTSEQVDTETLGGGRVHAEVSGVAHFLVSSEIEGLELARRILSYLPQNNLEDIEWDLCDDDVVRSCDALESIVPREATRPYDIGDVIAQVMDKDSFLEVHKLWAQNIRVGFARLGGCPVGVVGNNPGYLAGVLDIAASRKAARFVRTCNAFGLPVISLVDVPGFLPGKEQEHGGIIDHGAKLAFAYCEATVPKLAVILRKSYGGAYIVMSSKHVGADYNFAWEGAEIAVMGAAGAVEILYGKELKESNGSEQRKKDLSDEYNRTVASTEVASQRGFVDAVISRADTRKVLFRSLRAIIGKKEDLPVKRNGNVPL